MRIIADLQLHSKYSRAVSPKMVLSEIAKWAMIKKINLIATGDWTHPLWFREITSSLVEASDGLYKLNEKIAPDGGISQNAQAPYFLLSGEISSIYKQGGKQRRIHNLIFAPSLATVEKINLQLKKRGANLLSDGRPIVGLTSIEIAEIVFSIDENCLLIPAHCWTPWFSLYGSKSGFDSIEECFGKYANMIYAVETGLSSNPSMNWRIADLDNRTIISCSDAHSGPKLGREATVFEITDQNKTGEIKYQDVCDAIRQNPKGKCKIAYTIEFYPEEGKYHYSGHRVCLTRQTPEETKKMGTICPVCSKPLTVGVMHRVEELAKRSEAELELYQSGMYHFSKKYPKRPPFIQTVPLLEIISQSIGSPLGSEKVMEVYLKLCQKLDGEFSVLLKSEQRDIAQVAGDRIAEAVVKVRQGDIYIDPGYDGVFGVVKIWEKKNPSKSEEKKQLALFNN